MLGFALKSSSAGRSRKLFSAISGISLDPPLTGARIDARDPHNKRLKQLEVPNAASIQIEGMTCASGAGRAQKPLSAISGIICASVNAATKTAQSATIPLLTRRCWCHGAVQRVRPDKCVVPALCETCIARNRRAFSRFGRSIENGDCRMRKENR